MSFSGVGDDGGDDYGDGDDDDDHFPVAILIQGKHAKRFVFRNASEKNGGRPTFNHHCPRDHGSRAVSRAVSLAISRSLRGRRSTAAKEYWREETWPRIYLVDK
jgi:hypothetical protein